MNPLTQSLLFALAAAGANILGGVIVTSHKWARRSLRYFIALGSGFMLGTVFLEMVPESLKLTANAPALILLGYAIVHMFEHAFAAHLHFGEETHHDELLNPVVRISALVGMLVHTFFDGVAIGAGFIMSPSVGVLDFPGGISSQDSRRLHDFVTIREFRVSAEPRSGGRRLARSFDIAGSVGGAHRRRRCELCAAAIHRIDTLRRRHRPDAGGESRNGRKDGVYCFRGDGIVLTGADGGKLLGKCRMADCGLRR